MTSDIPLPHTIQPTHITITHLYPPCECNIHQVYPILCNNYLHYSCTHMTINEIELCNDALNFLSKYKNIKSITIKDCKWRGTRLIPLSTLQNLSTIKLLGCYLNDHDRQDLTACKTLKKITITNAKLGDLPFKSNTITHIKIVTVDYHTTFTDLTYFNECPNLRHIDISQCPLTIDFPHHSLRSITMSKKQILDEKMISSLDIMRRGGCRIIIK